MAEGRGLGKLQIGDIGPDGVGKFVSACAQGRDEIDGRGGKASEAVAQGHPKGDPSCLASSSAEMDPASISANPSDQFLFTTVVGIAQFNVVGKLRDRHLAQR